MKKALGANVSIAWEDCSDVVREAFAWRCDEEYEIHGRIASEEEPSVVVPGAVGLRDGVVSTKAWLKTMKWVEIDKFQATERKVWEVNGSLQGTYRNGETWAMLWMFYWINAYASSCLLKLPDISLHRTS